jgi:predicted RNA-binding protein YlxR (DUF448 family)
LPGSRRKHVPLRTCIACHRQRPKRELIRVVRTLDGQIEVDPKGKRSGRGAYLCADPQCWEVALEQGKLARALRCPVTDDDVTALRRSVTTLAEDSAHSADEKLKNMTRETNSPHYQGSDLAAGGRG